MKWRARALALGALVVGALCIAPTIASGAGSSRAVVNVSGNNTVISFNGSISGLNALRQVASVEYISYGGQGVAVCRINGVGNPPVQGQCLGEQSDGRYWSYWRAAPGAGGFSYSGQGAGSTTVTDGRVEGWSFSGGAPRFTSFCAVAGCTPPPPAPTAPPATAAVTGGSPAGGGAGASAPAGGSASTPVTAADGTPVTTSTTTAGPHGEGSKKGDGSEKGDGEQASSATRGTSGGSSSGDDGGDSGTPLGLGIAVVLVIVTVGTSAVLRRRRARAPSGGG